MVYIKKNVKLICKTTTPKKKKKERKEEEKEEWLTSTLADTPNLQLWLVVWTICKDSEFSFLFQLQVQVKMI